MVIKSIAPGDLARFAAATPNKSLEGHKLLMLAPESPQPEYLDRLRSEFPGLKVVFHEVDWPATATPDDFPEEEWNDTTILLASGNVFPATHLVPKLQYVQLMSAGANHILKKPLFADTDITFCTANGVHG